MLSGCRYWPAVLALVAAGYMTQVRSQVFVTEARDPGRMHPSAVEDDLGRRQLSSPSSSSEDRTEDPELSARLDRLQVLDARLSQMDVLDKMFQFVQLDTNMARISAQVDRISERLAEQTSPPVTCSPVTSDASPAGQTTLDTRLSVLEKMVESVASGVNSQLGQLHRQLDALLEKNVQLNTKTDTMREEMVQLLKSSNIVDDQLEQTDNNLRYLRDELDIVKQKTHSIHHQQQKSENAIKEEVKERVDGAVKVLQSLLFNVYRDVSTITAVLDRQQQAAEEARSRHDHHYEDDWDDDEQELEHRVHPLEDAEFRHKLIKEIRVAVAVDTKKIVSAAGCPRRHERRHADSLLRDLQHTINSTLEQAVTAQRRPTDCSELMQLGASSGVSTIHPNACSRQHKMKVYCDMETSGGGWTVIQRRGQFPGHRQLDFYKDWSTYKWGFGNVSEEFYLGNELIHLLTTSDDFVLRVELEDFSGDRRYAEYEHFSLDGDERQYRLHVGQYSGNAGDALTYHDGLPFTTKDQEHDTWAGKNCATHYRGGWWFANCHRANLNGVYLSTGHHSSYANGIIWHPWRGFAYSLKSARMMVRPRRVHEGIPGGQR